MTGDAAGPVPHLVDCYEALRQEVVSGTRGRSLGLALFLREGMAAWLHVGSTWMPEPAPRPRRCSDATPPAGLHGPMAVLLADMVLATVRQAVP